MPLGAAFSSKVPEKGPKPRAIVLEVALRCSGSGTWRSLLWPLGAVMGGFLDYRVTAVTVWSDGYQYSTTGLCRGHRDGPRSASLALEARTIQNDGITWCGTRSPLAELRANNAGSSVGKRLC